MTSSPVVLNWGSPYIHLHGRWDGTNTSWWAGTGLTIVASDLSQMSLRLGEFTTQPHLLVSVSVDNGPWKTLQLVSGANDIPLVSRSSDTSPTIVRVVSEGWQKNNMQLLAVELNEGAEPRKYTPQKLKFQFIGDSLSAGQYNAQGVVSAWTFLTAQTFKAEWDIQAQPGGALTDMECWGNVHGLSYQFFQVEDTGYFYTPHHNYTEPWDFKRDQPPTHVVIHIGANDASERYHVPVDEFQATYKDFISRLRTLYPTQPFFIFSPWGRFNDAGELSTYYTNPSPYKGLVESRHAMGDKNIFLVDTTGWVKFSDMFASNHHPNEEGHVNIARQFGEWLDSWGLHPEKEWETQGG